MIYTKEYEFDEHEDIEFGIKELFSFIQDLNEIKHSNGTTDFENIIEIAKKSKVCQEIKIYMVIEKLLEINSYWYEPIKIKMNKNYRTNKINIKLIIKEI
ncbi:MAG: hypothetical protein ACRCW9_06430 [Cetobacterium sp.]